MHGADEDAMMVTVGTALLGRAKEWFDTLGDMEMQRFENFEEVFKREIIKERGRMLQGRTRHQEVRESVKDYAIHIKTQF